MIKIYFDVINLNGAHYCFIFDAVSKNIIFETMMQFETVKNGSSFFNFLTYDQNFILTS